MMEGPEMVSDEKRAMIAEKWAYFRECSRNKRKKLLDHTFAFYVEYKWGREDAFRLNWTEKRQL